MKDAENLLLILGAGASHGCALIPKGTYVKNSAYQLPCSDYIFGKDDDDSKQRVFHDALLPYKLAQAAKARFEKQLSDPRNKVSLEEFLWKLVQSDKNYDRCMALQTKLYIRDLCWGFPREWLRGGLGTQTAYLDLFDTIKFHADRGRYKEVIILTLNYDLLADVQLTAMFRRAFSSAESYINFIPGWSYIKLHGSVDWGFPYKNVQVPRANIRETVLTLMDSEPLEFESKYLEKECTFNIKDEIEFFPKIVIPQSRKYAPVCPASHIEHLKKALSSGTWDILSIGYGGRDMDLNSIICDVKPNVSRFTVASGAGTAATCNELSYMNIVYENSLSFETNSVSFSDFVLASDGLIKFLTTN